MVTITSSSPLKRAINVFNIVHNGQPGLVMRPKTIYGGFLLSPEDPAALSVGNFVCDGKKGVEYIGMYAQGRKKVGNVLDVETEARLLCFYQNPKLIKLLSLMCMECKQDTRYIKIQSIVPKKRIMIFKTWFIQKNFTLQEETSGVVMRLFLQENNSPGILFEPKNK